MAEATNSEDLRHWMLTGRCARTWGCQVRKAPPWVPLQITKYTSRRPFLAEVVLIRSISVMTTVGAAGDSAD